MPQRAWVHRILLPLGLGLIIHHPVVKAFISPPDDSGEVQCVGLKADFNRLRPITTEDMEMIESPGEGRMFEVSSFNRIQRADGSVMSDRLRLKETVNTVPLHGAGVVATFKGCDPNRLICPRIVKDITGYTFTTINVSNGTTPTKTKEDAVVKIMEFFNVSEASVGNLTLEVFAFEDGDFLGYSTDVLKDNDGEENIRYFDVIVDAHTLDMLSICTLTGRFNVKRRNLRSLKKNDQKENKNPKQSANGINCGNCESGNNQVTWTQLFQNCAVNTLYLNDDERYTTCIQGVTRDGQSVLGPGPVSSLYWGGTFDCQSSTDSCRTNPLPQCADAISDVQYGAIKTMQYFQQFLGIKGGLKKSASEAVPVKANVHYSKNYCNAFYRYSVNTVMFGDCDCSYWTPLTTIDIVAHEIAHGVTRHSSNLEYQYQSGGMNEAFSDVVGCVMEFMFNDSSDKPDFDVGELLGNKLRSMEYPAEGGRSIASVCEYKSNLDVHHTSGPLNKAFVSSVRACQNSGCANLRECVILLGSIFMYANVQSLNPYSGYLDGAKATCSFVDEYLAAQYPQATCSESELVYFIRQGWSTVNVQLDSTCQAQECCSSPCAFVSPPRPTPVPTPVPQPVPTTAPVPTVAPLPTTTPPTTAPVPITTPVPTMPPQTLAPQTVPPVEPIPTVPASPGTAVTVPPDSNSDEPEPPIDSSESIILRIYNLFNGLFAVFGQLGFGEGGLLRRIFGWK